MNLISIPQLASKGLCTLVLPKYALSMDMKSNFDIIGYAPRHKDDLYYIGTSEKHKKVRFSDEEMNGI